MGKTLKQIISLKAALSVNAFCFYFKKLWLIGKWMPDAIYSRYGVKKVLSVLAVVMQQLIGFFGKPLYLITFVGFPLLLLSDAQAVQTGEAFSLLVQMLFFLNCIIGPLGDSKIFTVTRDKIVCMKYMHMNARTYLQGFLAFSYVPFFLYYLPWLLLAARVAGATPVQGFFVWLMLLSFRMMGEALQLLVFDRTGKVLSRNMLFNWAVIGIGLAGAYLPAVLGYRWPLAAMLLHPAGIAAYTLLGAASLWFITAGYRGYEEKYQRSIDLQYLLSNMLKASSGTSAAFHQVEMQEQDQALSSAEMRRFARLKGYAYLNALFFARHRRQLIKPVCYRLLAVVLLLAGMVALWAVRREAAVSISQNLTAVLPLFVYVMYFMTVADKASRAMFYNCDKDMLRYAYYRQPKTILCCFRIRLVRVSLYNLAVAGALCLAALCVCLLCGTPVLTANVLLFCAAILLLSVLFTAHHLCLYYIFQPYSESLQVKNPLFSAINMGMYLLCFFCLQIRTSGVVFTVSVLAFTALYIVAALLLVYFRAPTSFRVK